MTAPRPAPFYAPDGMPTDDACQWIADVHGFACSRCTLRCQWCDADIVAAGADCAACGGAFDREHDRDVMRYFGIID